MFSLTLCLCFSHADAPELSISLASNVPADQLKEGDEIRLRCDVKANPPVEAVTWYQGVSPNFFLFKRQIRVVVVCSYRLLWWHAHNCSGKQQTQPHEMSLTKCFAV